MKCDVIAAGIVNAAKGVCDLPLLHNPWPMLRSALHCLDRERCRDCCEERVIFIAHRWG